jgi:hypothetical protein
MPAASAGVAAAIASERPIALRILSFVIACYLHENSEETTGGLGRCSARNRGNESFIQEGGGNESFIQEAGGVSHNSPQQSARVAASERQ